MKGLPPTALVFKYSHCDSSWDWNILSDPICRTSQADRAPLAWHWRKVEITQHASRFIRAQEASLIGKCEASVNDCWKSGEVA